MGSFTDTVAIIGYGRFGRALGELLQEARVSVRALDSGASLPPDIALSSLEDAARQASTIILAVPVSEMPRVLSAARPHLSAEHTVLDVGSVKLRPIEAMRQILGEAVPWAGTHPLFGPTSLALGERPLRMVVCPNPMHPAAVAKARALFEKIGGEVSEIDAEAHDRLMADTHALAFFIAKGLLDAGVEFSSELAPPSFRAIARTVEAVRSDAGHLFGTIHRDNPFSKEARSRLVEALSAVHETIDELDKGAIPEGDALVIPDLGDHSPELKEARELIDDIDRELVSLLSRRAQLANRAKAAKAELGRGVRDPGREGKLLEVRRAWAAEHGLDQDSVIDVFAAILRFSRKLQADQ